MAKNNRYQFPIIDLFAGPGGLGEGFSSFQANDRSNPFQIGLSIECDKFAHETLLLRKFFKKLLQKGNASDYYLFLQEKISKDELFKLHVDEHEASKEEAWLATLGKTPEDKINKRIKDVVGEEKNWVLIGGPPCKAYSIVGRSRNRGIRSDDPNTRLYREYLKILHKFSPPVFLMENVKGLLSSRINNESIFERIISHLEQPSSILEGQSKAPGKRPESSVRYKIFSLVKKHSESDLFGWSRFEASDFVINCEKYGIPQARHRVILMGVREDIQVEPLQLKPGKEINVIQALEDLPRLRSGLSKGSDSSELWEAILLDSRSSPWFSKLKKKDLDVYNEISKTLDQLKGLRQDRGGEYISWENEKVSKGHPYFKWILDKKIGGVCNHSTRGHIIDDLFRYLYSSCYTKVHKISPKLSEFPETLLPKHKNVSKALNGSMFSDRFRTQVEGRPSTTITSHISKDGHYFIHYDPSQCRSLTVREAARLQTFPDNYFFCGPRTSQYTQVGNAVPPLLAKQVAEIVFDILNNRS